MCHRFTLEQGDFTQSHPPKESNFRTYFLNRIERGITFFGVRKEWSLINAKCFVSGSPEWLDRIHLLFEVENWQFSQKLDLEYGCWIFKNESSLTQHNYR